MLIPFDVFYNYALANPCDDFMFRFFNIKIS